MFSRCILSSTGQAASPASLPCISPNLAPLSAPDQLSPFVFQSFAPDYPSAAAEDLKANVEALFAPRTRGPATHSTTAGPDPAMDNELERLKLKILAQSPATAVPRLQSPTIRPGRMTPLALRPPLQPETAFKVFEGLVGRRTKIGMYSMEERQRRIRRYKAKMLRRRQRHPVSRVFEGRRAVAYNKTRVNGRFCKLAVNN